MAKKKKSKLDKAEQDQLKKARKLQDMKKSEGWQEVLKPLLESKRDHSFPDPAEFKDHKEFNYASMVASIYKKVVAEIIQMVENQEQLIEHLTDKQEGKVKSKFRIGGKS